MNNPPALHVSLCFYPRELKPVPHLQLLLSDPLWLSLAVLCSCRFFFSPTNSTCSWTVCVLVWYTSWLSAAEGKTVNWGSRCCVLCMEGIFLFHVNMVICTFVLRQTSRNLVHALFTKHTSFSTQLEENYKKDPLLGKYHAKSVVTAFRYHLDLHLFFSLFFFYYSWTALCKTFENLAVTKRNFSINLAWRESFVALTCKGWEFQGFSIFQHIQN